MNIGVVLAGGIGVRMNSNVPKQYMIINKKEVIYYPISTLKKNKNIDKVIVVADKIYHKHLSSNYDVEVCECGSTRNETVRNVIDYIIENKYDCVNIVFVDSARPLLNDDMINSGLEFLKKYPGVITCQKITDSLALSSELVNRDNYCLIQTPEMFSFDKLIDYDKNSEYTAIYQQITGSIYKNFISYVNIKLTYKSDLIILEKLLS